LAARGDSPEAQAALGELCTAYYAPVLAFLRRSGRDDDTARDLAQEFFTRLLARRGLDSVVPGRGRFRSFLLGAVKHFLADQYDRAQAAKRGNGHASVSLDAPTNDTTSTLQIPDPAASVSDAVFDRQWALTILDRALAVLADEHQAADKSDHFETLKPWLTGDTEELSQAEAARRLDMNEGALKVAIHRLRKRFRELVKAEITQTVGADGDVQSELNYLLEVLSRPG